jgi:hypothetical protein
VTKQGDVKPATVERITGDLMRSSGNALSHDQAKRIARDSAERINRERKEQKK